MKSTLCAVAAAAAMLENNSLGEPPETVHPVIVTRTESSNCIRFVKLPPGTNYCIRAITLDTNVNCAIRVIKQQK